MNPVWVPGNWDRKDCLIGIPALLYINIYSVALTYKSYKFNSFRDGAYNLNYSYVKLVEIN